MAGTPRKPDQEERGGRGERGTEQDEGKQKRKGKRKRARRRDRPVASVACINSEQGLQPYANFSCTGKPRRPPRVLSLSLFSS